MRSQTRYIYLLFILVIISSSSCNAFSNQPLKELSDAQLPISIIVHDEWGGLSPVAPVIIEFTLLPDGQNYTGQVNYSVGGYFTKTYQDTETILIPSESVELFLKKLSTANIKAGEYEPNITWTDDYPKISFRVEYESKVFEFSTESQGDKNIPWKLTIDSTNVFVVNSGKPADALQILKSFLKDEKLNNLFQKAESECSSDYFECPDN